MSAITVKIGKRKCHKDYERAWDSGAGATPLLRATRSGNIELVSLLLDKGANVSTDMYPTPLMVAAAIGNEALTFLLLEHGADARWQHEKTLR